MSIYKNRYRTWLKITAMVVVCLFTLNSLTWANPDLGRATLQAELFFNKPYAETLLGATLKYIVEATKEDFENFRSRVFPTKGGCRHFYDFDNKEELADGRWAVPCALLLGKKSIGFKGIVDLKDSSIQLVAPDDRMKKFKN